jgi:hypothetical protein
VRGEAQALRPAAEAHVHRRRRELGEEGVEVGLLERGVADDLQVLDERERGRAGERGQVGRVGDP